MMDELKEVKRVLNPTEVLLVVDAMTGQEAAGMCAYKESENFTSIYGLCRNVVKPVV